MIDRDEDGYPDDPKPFYTEALPCESCGHPTFQGRVWNAEHEIWIAIDCSCNAPDQPLPACMIEVYRNAQTVGQMMDDIKAHRQTCPVCRIAELPERKQPMEAGGIKPKDEEEAA